MSRIEKQALMKLYQALRIRIGVQGLLQGCRCCEEAKCGQFR